MSQCLAGSDAPSQGSGEPQASFILTWPSPSTSPQAGNHGRHLFLPNPCFFPQEGKVLAAHWVRRDPRAWGSQDGNLADPKLPKYSLGKYCWDHPKPSLFAPSYKGWARGGTSLQSDYNWDLSLHNEWGNGGNIEHHPCHAQWEINPRWNSKSPRTYRNPDRYPGGGAFIVERYKVFFLSLIL